MLRTTSHPGFPAPVSLPTRLLGVLLCLGLSTVAPAQAQEESEGKRTAIRSGAWALQFQIDQDTILGSFQGGVLSAKCHLSESRAVRFGVSADTRSRDGSSEVAALIELPADSMSSTRAAEVTNSDHDLHLGAQYIHNSAPAKPIVLFYGGGPYVSYSLRRTDITDIVVILGHTNTDHQTTTLSEESRAWSLGVSGVFGVEWFASRSISLHAEYGLQIGHTWTKGTRADDEIREASESHSHRDSRTHADTWTVGSTAVKLGLSVYL